MRRRLERSVAGQPGGAASRRHDNAGVIASRRQGNEDEQVRRRDEQRKQNDQRDERRCDAVRGVHRILMCTVLCLHITQHVGGC